MAMKVDLPDELNVFYRGDLFEILTVENDGARIEITVTKNNHIRTDIWMYSFSSQRYILDNVGGWQNVR